MRRFEKKNFAFLAALVLAAGGSDAFANNNDPDPTEGLSEAAQAEIEEMVENGKVNPEEVQELVEDAISEAMEHMYASHAAHQAIDEARNAADAARDAADAAREAADAEIDAAMDAADAALEIAHPSANAEADAAHQAADAAADQAHQDLENEGPQ